jgi:hypothetical protein
MEEKTTFSKVAELWKADKKQYVKKSTYAAYSLLIYNHLVPDLGKKTDIQEKMCRGWSIENSIPGCHRKPSRTFL